MRYMMQRPNSGMACKYDKNAPNRQGPCIGLVAPARARQKLTAASSPGVWQAKLRVGSHGDFLEREADVAAAVVILSKKGAGPFSKNAADPTTTC